MLQQLTEKLNMLAERVQEAQSMIDVDKELSKIKQIVEELLDTEKHGITEPPAIMWTKHNQLRETKRRLKNLVESSETMSFSEFKKQLCSLAGSLTFALSSHIFKENDILFPTALSVVTEQEWVDVKGGFYEIGYCCFTPEHLMVKTARDVENPKVKKQLMPEGTLQFETGSLSKEEIGAILNTLPLEITFVS
jgi:DUF438 domain-containing protein